jgi:hypothetical protein
VELDRRAASRETRGLTVDASFETDAEDVLDRNTLLLFLAK